MILLNCAKGGDARPETGKGTRCSLRGALDTAAVLRGFLNSQAKQIFFGPSVLGVYRAIGVEAGLQFPLYRDAGPLFPKEHYRFTVNFAYFF